MNMSQLTDFILGTVADTDYLTTGRPIERFVRVETTDFDSILLALLYNLATGDSEDHFLADFDETEVAYTEDGPWLYKLPRSFVARLSELSVPEIATIAANIVASDDCEGCTLVALHTMLSSLVTLCQKAGQAPETIVYYRAVL
jgi:hypothetical protein